MDKTLICLLLLFTLACSQSKEKQSVSVETPKTQVGKQEDFASFYDQFTWNKAFRKDRSDIILPGKSNDYFNGEEFIAEIYLDSAEIRSKKSSNDEVYMERINLGKQKSQRHIFYLKDTLWRLKKIETVSCNQLKNASFLTFLYQFSTDSVYQKEHIFYPLIYQTYDEEDLETEIIKKLPQDSLEFVQMISNFSNLLVNESSCGNSDFRLVHLQGRDTGIYIEYHFKKIRGKWFYVKLVDFST